MILEDLTDSQDGGIVKNVIVKGKGDGKPCNGDKVTVHYVCKISNGNETGSSRDKNDNFQFTIGKDEVIKGLEIGVKSMKKCEKCSLIVQPKYAHGIVGLTPKIPANATLELQVELITWEKDVLNGNISRIQLIKGTGYTSPKDGNIVEVHIQTKSNGKILEEQNTSFELGKGSDYNIVPGVELALKKFKKGEKCILKNIPPNADVDFEVTLHNFEKNKKIWEYETYEKIVQANFCKIKGTNLFKDGKYFLAAKQYKKIVTFLENETHQDNEICNQISQLLLTGLLNLTMCFLKMEKYLDALIHCNQVLHIEPNNTKGLYRRGIAHLGMNNYDMAEKDFQAVLQVDGNNKAAVNQLAICKNKLKEQRNKDKQVYANMFQRFAESDAKKEN